MPPNKPAVEELAVLVGGGNKLEEGPEEPNALPPVVPEEAVVEFPNEAVPPGGKSGLLVVAPGD